MKDNGKVRFSIDKTGFFAESAVLLLILAAIFRVFGCWGVWNRGFNDIVMLLALPVFCCLLLVLSILLLGKKGFCLSFIPVLLGVMSFVYSSFDSDSWVVTVLWILFYLVVAVLYTATVFGWIGTRWLLPPLFGLPFLYLVIMRDLPALCSDPESVSFVDGMREMSILFMLAAMFCIGMGLRRRHEKTVTEQKEPVQAPVPSTTPPEASVSPAPVPEAPAPAEESAAIPEVPASVSVAEKEKETVDSAEPLFDEAPYTPMLTLDPEPWEPEAPTGDGRDENAHE